MKPETTVANVSAGADIKASVTVVALEVRTVPLDPKVAEGLQTNVSREQLANK